ncbi:hypothetical protein [Actinocatenispora comari]|jgi:hypothetical protein|uniref:SH3 domain-containing protein n=1 Tax=Actinocatenispora comari TaxID=2807577 RepID=A0A8J4EKH3_9ACTN|nr:hypothetical protein [Actinocatenispora comari]GIL27396.1 hypothetical protein NUM_26500 [Actinocatenispora comari]
MKQSRGRLVHRIITLAAAAVAGLALLAAGPSAASAGTSRQVGPAMWYDCGSPYPWTKTFTADGVRIRTRPATGTVVGLAYQGDRFTITDDATVNGDMYCYGTDLRTGVRGWVPLIYFGTGTCINCVAPAGRSE